MPLLGVVFDFDGVIVNSEPLHLRAYQDVLRPLGLDLRESDYYERYLGYDDVGMFRAVAEDQRQVWGEEEIDRLVRTKAERLAELAVSGAALFPGAAECVRRLAATAPLAIASGALRHEIEAVLDRAGLRRHFSVIVGAEDAPRSKPAPDPYLRAVELLRMMGPGIHGPTSNFEPGTMNSEPTASGSEHVAPRTSHVERAASECYVAIEDSRWGLESARAAGLKTIAVTHTYPPDQLPDADLILSSLDDVTLGALQKLCG